MFCIDNKPVAVCNCVVRVYVERKQHEKALHAAAAAAAATFDRLGEVV